jgi:hypothetical protein
LLRHPPEIDNFEPWIQRSTNYFLTTRLQTLTTHIYFTTADGVAPPPSIQS